MWHKHLMEVESILLVIFFWVMIDSNLLLKVEISQSPRKLHLKPFSTIARMPPKVRPFLSVGFSSDFLTPKPLLLGQLSPHIPNRPQRLKTRPNERDAPSDDVGGVFSYGEDEDCAEDLEHSVS